MLVIIIIIIIKYFRPILDKKDPPEDKELAILDLSGSLSNVIPIVISCQSNQDRNNLWLTLAQRHEIGAEIGVIYARHFSTPAIARDQVNRRDNSTITFTGANENLTQFIKVSEIFDFSKFVRLFHRQGFALYGAMNR